MLSIMDDFLNKLLEDNYYMYNSGFLQVDMKLTELLIQLNNRDDYQEYMEKIFVIHEKLKNVYIQVSHMIGHIPESNISEDIDVVRAEFLSALMNKYKDQLIAMSNNHEKTGCYLKLECGDKVEDIFLDDIDKVIRYLTYDEYGKQYFI